MIQASSDKNLKTPQEGGGANDICGSWKQEKNNDEEASMLGSEQGHRESERRQATPQEGEKGMAQEHMSKSSKSSRIEESRQAKQKEMPQSPAATKAEKDGKKRMHKPTNNGMETLAATIAAVW
eukprot:11643822-Karenia_brevis.AAC.1